jgi:hypothetical protein
MANGPPGDRARRRSCGTWSRTAGMPSTPTSIPPFPMSSSSAGGCDPSTTMSLGPPWRPIGTGVSATRRLSSSSSRTPCTASGPAPTTGRRGTPPGPGNQGERLRAGSEAEHLPRDPVPPRQLQLIADPHSTPTPCPRGGPVVTAETASDRGQLTGIRAMVWRATLRAREPTRAWRVFQPARGARGCATRDRWIG